MEKYKYSNIALILASLIFLSLPLYSATITVSTDCPGADIAPTFIGLFIEDINFNGDGGLYAELVKNRSFEFPQAMMGWSTIKRGSAKGSVVAIHKQEYHPADTSCLRIHVDQPGKGLGVSNEGFRGMGIKKGEKYYFSVYARTDAPAQSLKIEVLNPDGKILLEGELENIQGDWKNYYCLMEANATEPRARLDVLAMNKGIVDLDMISLFPQNTAGHTDRPIPGLRKDLVEMLAAIKPGFLRFPGGCIVEGMTLDNRYQWKNTIGDINERETIINRWNLEFSHRLTPDYFQSFGLGFYEYFLLSEQIGAEPLPIINCGMACQFNTGQTVAVDKLAPYVQDALDLIEFANGPADSKWGCKRVEMGHPKPFNLKYLGVGNEQWGPQYVERYKIFEKTLKEKYPEVKLIAATGSDPAIFPNGPAEVKYLWDQWRILKPDIVDEHFYRPYQWFFENTDYYDNYDPEGPKIFVGEYAAMTHGVANPDNRNNLTVALAEAAFLTGMERNAAVVTMSSYAPLAGHVDAWQWKPNLLWFDNLNAYATPDYYVQHMFSLYRGDTVLPVQSDETGLFTSASLDSETGYIYLKAVNYSSDPVTVNLKFNGVEKITPQARVITLSGQPGDENSIRKPKNIVPVEKEISLNTSEGQLQFSFQPYSLTVIEITPLSKDNTL